MKQAFGRNPVNLAVPALVVANMALAMGPWLVRIARVQGQVGPVASGFWRLTLALPVLVIAMRRDSPRPAPAAGPALIGVALLAGLFFGADLGAWHVGILHTRLANATLLGNVTAILFPVYGFVAARSWPSHRQVLALVLAALGAMLLLGRSYELSGRNLLGDLLCVLAGLCYTGYLIAADRARTGLGSWTTLTWSVLAGSPLLLAVALALGEPIWPRIWWPLLLMTLGSQIVGQGAILYAVGRVSNLVVGVMLLLQPIVAATVGWLVYGEVLTPFDLVGATAVGAAVLLVRGAERSMPARKIGLSTGS